MNYPWTIAFLLPVLIVCISLLGNYWAVGCALFAVLSFAIEIKVKKGNLSKHSIKNFFNTPIVHRGFGNEAIQDNSPKVSVLKGVLIILGGATLVVAGLVFVFG